MATIKAKKCPKHRQCIFVLAQHCKCLLSIWFHVPLGFPPRISWGFIGCCHLVGTVKPHRTLLTHDASIHSWTHPADVPPSHPSWIIDMHPAKVWPFTTCLPWIPSLNAACTGHLKIWDVGSMEDMLSGSSFSFQPWPWPFFQPPPPTPQGHTFCARLPVFPHLCHGLLCFEFGISFYSSYGLIREWPMQNKHPYPNASVIAHMCLTLEIGFLVSCLFRKADLCINISNISNRQ